MATTPKSDFSERCCCGRVGDTFALLLCPVDAPIPFIVSPKGKREARRMKQWDAIVDVLESKRVKRH